MVCYVDLYYFDIGFGFVFYLEFLYGLRGLFLTFSNNESDFQTTHNQDSVHDSENPSTEDLPVKNSFKPHHSDQSEPSEHSINQVKPVYEKDIPFQHPGQARHQPHNSRRNAPQNYGNQEAQHPDRNIRESDPRNQDQGYNKYREREKDVTGKELEPEYARRREQPKGNSPSKSGNFEIQDGDRFTLGITPAKLKFQKKRARTEEIDETIISSYKKTHLRTNKTTTYLSGKDRMGEYESTETDPRTTRSHRGVNHASKNRDEAVKRNRGDRGGRSRNDQGRGPETDPRNRQRHSGRKDEGKEETDQDRRNRIKEMLRNSNRKTRERIQEAQQNNVYSYSKKTRTKKETKYHFKCKGASL